MRIPFHKPDISGAEHAAVLTAIQMGHLAYGPEVEDFEYRVARFHDVPYAVAVASCTAGFQCLWHALGMEPSDDAVFPTYTFAGPPMSVLHHGAQVRFADSAESHPNLDAQAMSDYYGARNPFAIVPTLFAGDPIDDLLYGQAYESGSHLILDAAQAFGSRLTHTSNAPHLRPIASVFSFYATKPITTGMGGMVLTHDEALARELRSLRLHGFREAPARHAAPHEHLRYDVRVPGFKANLSAMGAAIGLVQLDRHRDMMLDRYRIAQRYDHALKEFGIAPPHFELGSNRHLYTIKVPGSRRDAFVDHMAREGIGVSIHFRPLHLHSFWQRHRGEEASPYFDRAEAHYRDIVSLPISSALTREEVSEVIEAMGKFKL